MRHQGSIVPIKKKQEFQEIYLKHDTYHSRHFRVLYRREKKQNLRYAITISKKTEPLSTKRNKAKRQIKNILYTTELAFNQKIRMIIFPKKSMFKEVVKTKELRSLFDKFFVGLSDDH